MGNSLNDILDTKMSRKDFIMKVGVGAAVVTGLGAGVKVLNYNHNLKQASALNGTQPTNGITGVSGGGTAVDPATYVNVKDFGAVGDGVTDDTNAIRAAILASKTQGMPLFFPSFVYRTSASLDVTGSTIFGYGAVLKLTDAIQECTMLKATAGTTILGITLDGNAAKTTTATGVLAGIYVYAANGWGDIVTLRDVTVSNLHSEGIRIGTSIARTDPATLPLARTFIEASSVNNIGSNGIRLDFVRGAIISQCHVDRATNGINSINSYGTKIIGCEVRNGSAHGIVSQYGLYTQISNNFCEGNADSGIVIGGGSVSKSPERYPLITSNTCRGNIKNGISADTTISGQVGTPVDCHGAITSNVCTANGINGINLQSSSYMVVSGNMVANNGTAGIGVSARYASIDANLCENSKIGIGLFGSSSSPNYGYHRIGINLFRAISGQNYQINTTYVPGVVWAATDTTMPVNT